MTRRGREVLAAARLRRLARPDPRARRRDAARRDHPHPACTTARRSERLSVGRIALAGDAAHPMLPNLGQGACQAIEDAVVLGEELAASDVVAALERYSARRAEHTADVVRASRQMSRVAHLRSPVAAGLRNALLRASPTSATLRRLEPIVGHALGGASRAAGRRAARAGRRSR